MNNKFEIEIDFATKKTHSLLQIVDSFKIGTIKNQVSGNQMPITFMVKTCECKYPPLANLDRITVSKISLCNTDLFLQLHGSKDT